LSDGAGEETEAQRAPRDHTKPDFNAKTAKNAKFQTIPICAFLRGLGVEIVLKSAVGFTTNGH
jgi:hypothetical protein